MESYKSIHELIWFNKGIVEQDRILAQKIINETAKVFKNYKNKEIYLYETLRRVLDNRVTYLTNHELIINYLIKNDSNPKELKEKILFIFNDKLEDSIDIVLDKMTERRVSFDDLSKETLSLFLAENYVQNIEQSISEAIKVYEKKVDDFLPLLSTTDNLTTLNEKEKREYFKNMIHYCYIGNLLKETNLDRFRYMKSVVITDFMNSDYFKGYLSLMYNSKKNNLNVLNYFSTGEEINEDEPKKEFLIMNNAKESPECFDLQSYNKAARSHIEQKYGSRPTLIGRIIALFARK